LNAKPSLADLVAANGHLGGAIDHHFNSALAAVATAPAYDGRPALKGLGARRKRDYGCCCENYSCGAHKPP